jgi:hypothetical protein
MRGFAVLRYNESCVCNRLFLTLLSMPIFMRTLPSSFRAALLLAFLPLGLLACGLFAAPLAANPLPPQGDPMFGPLPVFEFHSGFWLNLHHMLYQEAKQRSSPAEHPTPGKYAHSVIDVSLGERPVLTQSEQRAWTDAVNFYAANYANHDLLFSNDLVILKNQLGDFEDCDELSGVKKKNCDAGLPPNITHILEAAGAVYRAHYWVNHDRANRRWIAVVAPLIRGQGVGISERLAAAYQTKWPKPKIRVDVSAYANWAGAYTTLDPLRVTISSLDPRNQDTAALEVLFHEASHGIAEPVEQAIARECRQRDKAIPRDLWHALVSYTTGELIRDAINSGDSATETASNVGPADGSTPPSFDDRSIPGGGSTPYAVREHLYARGWDDYLTLLTRYWQPYLEGHASFDDAIARMVSSL